MAGPKKVAEPKLESLEGYKAQKDFLDAVLDNPQEEVTVDLGTHRLAMAFRLRCYDLRKADRRNNNKIYEEGDPKRHRSDYDAILLSIRPTSGILMGQVPTAPTISIKKRPT